ncbi:MAG: DUF4349 domain-containing protein [Oscillospiraceae bacterium]|nr:DUF4349 domain-containing protein [Oscillospiraceae bacterium]
MKKKISILLLVILAATLLTACASAGGQSSVDYYYGGTLNETAGSAMYALPEAEAPAAVQRRTAGGGDYAEEALYDADYSYVDDSISYSSGGDHGGISSTIGGGSSIVPITAPINEGLAEKIIYSVHANIETMEFDETVAKIHQLLGVYNAFIESSSVSGINYESRFYGWNEYRYAYFNLRVPVGQLNAMVENLDSLGNITHQSNDATNITTQFFDTQSRLNSLNIQEERLLDMLSKAEDVPDLIMIEERLSDVRYQIEMLTTTLTGWQRQVDYSTVTLSIIEVIEFTEQPVINISYWQQISDGFMATIKAIGKFFMDLFRWFIVSAPVLLVIAVIILAAVLFVKYKVRSYKKKNAAQAAVIPEETDNNNQ